MQFSKELMTLAAHYDQGFWFLEGTEEDRQFFAIGISNLNSKQRFLVATEIATLVASDLSDGVLLKLWEKAGAHISTNRKGIRPMLLLIRDYLLKYDENFWSRY